jgi:HEAT repeat protein
MDWEEEQLIRALGPNARREIVDALIRAIHNGDEEERKAAADRLSTLCIFDIVSDVVPIEPLVDLLHGADSRLRELAEYGLAHTDGRSMTTLLRLLEDAAPVVRASAAKALAHVGDAAIAAAPALRRRLDDEVIDVRQRAAFALGLIQATDDVSVGALIAMAQSLNSGDRSSAMHALGNIAQKLSDDRLRSRVEQQAVAASTDSDADTRWGALYVMESLTTEPDVWLPLIERGLHDASQRVQEMAASGLKKLAPRIDLEALLPVVIPLAKHEGLLGRTVIELLGQAGPQGRGAVPQLLEVAATPDYHAVHAAVALWRITRDARIVVPVLEREFDDNGEAVCDVICEIGKVAAPLLPKLLQALGDDSYYDLQWAAADALGAVASDDSVVLDALGHALVHPSGIVSGAAARALANVGAAAVPMLVAHLTPPFTPHAAVSASGLSCMGPAASSAVDALRIAHRDGDRALRIWSAIALARVAADVNVLQDLIELVDSEDDDEPKRQAIEALAAIGAPAKKALRVLRRARGHWNSDVVDAAEAAISVITARSH